jgi:spore coat protein U domain-containing protein, fimbrial subunit CupE1/2/3/6
MNTFKLNPLSKSLAVAALLGIGAVMVAPKAHAGNATSNLSVTASVTANCTISTSAVAFGSYDPVVANASNPLNASGSVTIACTKGSAPNVTMDLGAHASGGNRYMSDGGSNTLGYQLYQPPSTTPNDPCTFPGSQVWGTSGSAIFTPTAPGSKSARTYNVCGTVAAGQDVAVGSYADTVVATVNF